MAVHGYVLIVAGSYVKVKATKKLNTFKQEVKQQLEDNIIRLMDTRGNITMAIKLRKRLANSEHKKVKKVCNDLVE